MSYTKEVTLWCDAEGCAEWITLNNYESKGGHVETARIWARRAHWTYREGKDRCKQHSATRQRVVADPIFDGPSISLDELRTSGPTVRT